MNDHELSRRTFLQHAGVVAGAPAVAACGLRRGRGADGPPAGRPVRPHPEYEIDDGAAADPAAWAAVGPGLHLSFASRDSCFRRHEVPEIVPVREAVGAAWRGERVNVLALAWAGESLSQLRAVPGPLRNEKGATIPPESVQVRFVGYVASDHDFASLETGCGESKASPLWLLPDLLDPLPRIDLAARSTRPLWISIDVPPDAQPGRYSGELNVAWQGGGRIPLKVDLEVQDPVLPDPSRWRFRLDLWQNPWAVAHQHRLEPWSRAHLEALRPHLSMLAGAGAKFVTAYVCHSPWSDETFVPDGTMVEWIRRPDGAWTFDYSTFDRYVELAGECGLADSITLYTMVPWKNRVRYLDLATGDYSWREWPARSEEFKAFWRTFLADLRRHLVQRGWFGRTYMGINENELEDSLASIRTLKEDSADWKVTYAGKWHPELDARLDDYCVIVDESMSPDEVRRRRQAGRTTTFYVCCHPPRPNDFVFSPPAESAWMGWYAAAYGYDGFLRWAYDNWPGDPARDARHVRWPAGDCFLVYPGARSSIRFERLREGIADFEKVRILRERLEGRSDEAHAEAAEKLREALGRFDYARVQKEPADGAVHAGRELLNDLTRRLFP